MVQFDAMSDFAIRGSRTYGAAGDSLTIDNYGTITGYITAGDENTTFNNYSSNSWNIRNFADTDGDGIRDAKAVAISDFGGGKDIFVNKGSGAVRLLSVTGEKTTDTTGEYVPQGALSSAQKGIVHGQLLNLETFDNAGLIDLSDNGLAGDVFVITGGGVAGTYGSGKYISNGGRVKLDSLLNEGGAISQSDVLVLDDVVLGSAATGLQIIAVLGSPGGLTEQSGIKVVEVLGSQPSGSFTLAAPVTYGAYEYRLFQTGSNWYLKNNDNGMVFSNPNAGGYLANQYAAGAMFNHNILDRQNSIVDPDRTFWMNVKHGKLETGMLDDKQKAEIRTTRIQLGMDLYQGDAVQAGIFGGFGTADIENQSNQTGSLVDGDVDGRHFGVYVSWVPEEEKGFYSDFWAYYAKFDNELSGAAQQYMKTEYKSSSYAVSGEVGYKFMLPGQNFLNRDWLLKPHAQLTYMNNTANSFYDQNNTPYNNNEASGVQTRLGARLSGEKPEGNGISPYVELNWLHDARDNSISVAGLEQESKIGQNVAEIKVGVHGDLTDKLSLWTHVGAQTGSQDYENYEARIGLGWSW